MSVPNPDENAVGDKGGGQIAAQLVEEVSKLVPEFLEDPIDLKMSQGNAAFCVIDDAGFIRGRIFGADRAKGRWCFGIVNRKVIQVWSTGYATGRFEELVYAGKLDDARFGINRPDFIGWQGGVPLLLKDGALIAAAFSGFRGIKDTEIVERAAARIGGLQVKRD
jgi:glc operon protein GlcG